MAIGLPIGLPYASSRANMWRSAAMSMPANMVPP
jgi:hypothetical protein